MKKGFTLIELIAVMAIVGVLSIMIVPNVIKLLNGSMEDTMKITENEVVDAANLYVEDYCRNPINDEYRDNCLVDKKTINES